MSLIEQFFQGENQPMTLQPKSLRLNAREAAEYLTGLPYIQPEPTMPLWTPGVGQNGESSN